MTIQAYRRFDESRETRTVIGTAIAKGLAYEAIFIDAAVPSGAKRYFRAVTSPNKFIIIFNREMVTDRERMFYRSYTSFSGGTLGDPLTIRAMRLDSLVAAETVANIYTVAPSFDPASLFVEDPLFSAVGAGSRSGGSTNTEIDYRIIPPNQEFLIELENQATTDAYLKVRLKFAEVRPEYMPVSEDLL